MRYVFDNDLHIHSKLSLCSNDPGETTEAILEYAKENNLKTIVLTDHYWDETVPGASGWYQQQDWAHIEQALPLPKADGLRFLFGCETDLDKYCTVGVARETYDRFAFVIIPTTHLHMKGFTCNGDEDAGERAKLWIQRFDAVLDMDLPFHKIGIAHLTCSLVYAGHHYEVLSQIPDDEMHRLFKKAAACGVGIELNFPEKELDLPETVDIILRPYRIAKEEGCKFYFGSDAHHPAELAAEKQRAERTIDALGLEESDKFILA